MSSPDKSYLDTNSSAANRFEAQIPYCTASPHFGVVRHEYARCTFDITAPDASGICYSERSYLDTNFSAADPLAARTQYCITSTQFKSVRHKSAPRTLDMTAPDVCGMCYLDRSYLHTNFSSANPFKTRTQYCSASQHPGAVIHEGSPGTLDITAQDAHETHIICRTPAYLNKCALDKGTLESNPLRQYPSQRYLNLI